MTTIIEEAKQYIRPPVLLTGDQQDEICMAENRAELDAALGEIKNQTFKLVGNPWQTTDGVFLYFEHPGHPYDSDRDINAPFNIKSYENAVLVKISFDRRFMIVCADSLELLLQAGSDCAVLSLDAENAMPVLSDRAFAGRKSIAQGEIAQKLGHQRLHAVQAEHECGSVEQMLRSPAPGGQ